MPEQIQQIDPQMFIQLYQFAMFAAAGIGFLVVDRVVDRVGQLSAWAEMKFSKDGKTPNETAGIVAQGAVLAGSALLAGYFSM